MRRSLTALLALGMFQFAAAAHAEDVVLLTPYLSSVATNEMIETFKAESVAKGWTVNVIDTRGDFQQLASRVEDVANAGVKAIVLVSVDPGQIGDQVAAAAGKGIPVISLDGALAKGVALNITTDNFALGTQLSDYLFKAMGDKGNVVKFFHSAHPGVHKRELALDKALGEHPNIKVIAEHYVQVPGPIDNARQAMETFVRQYGDQINGVWAAWDEPAIGALLAIQSDKPDAKVLIAGIDGNPQAIDLIKQCTNLVATVRQDFPGIAKVAVQELAAVMEGKKPEKPEIFVSANVIDRASLGVTCN